MKGFTVLGYVELGLLALAMVVVVFAVKRFPDRSEEAHGMRNDESKEASARRGEIAKHKSWRNDLLGSAAFLAFCSLVLMIVQAAQQ